jgi:hypothetical protein
MPKVNLQWCHPQIVLSMTCLDTGTWMRAFASRTKHWSRSGMAKVFFQCFSTGTLIQHRTIKNIAWILNFSYRLIWAWTTSHHYICNAHAGWHVQGEDQLQQGSCGEGQVKTTQPQFLCSLCQHMFLIRKIVQQLKPRVSVLPLIWQIHMVTCTCLQIGYKYTVNLHTPWVGSGKHSPEIAVDDCQDLSEFAYPEAGRHKQLWMVKGHPFLWVASFHYQTGGKTWLMS